LTLNGTLYISNLGPELFAAGDSFKIFNSASCTGIFSSILPESPGSGLVWDTTGLSKYGILQIAKVNGISDTDLPSKIQVYPNPAKNSLLLKLADNASDFMLLIENLKGQVVYTGSKKNTTEYEVDLSSFSSGIYTLRFIIDKQVYTDRFIKN
jgi:hypothetical protein